MAAEVSADLTLINDEDTLRKMWSETEDFGKKKEIRARMYKIREQRLKDFYTTGEVGTEITSRKHATTRHTESIGDQGFLSMKTKEIRDSESPTRDFSRRGNNGYWSSVEERGYTTGNEDGAIVERKEETKRGQGVLIEGNTETQMALSAQNVHEKSEKADENTSVKAETVRQSSAMATSSVSKSGDTSSLVESSEKQSAKTAKEEKTANSSSSSSTTKWSSSSSSKRVVSSSQSYQVTSGGERVIQDSSTKAITSGDNVSQQQSNVHSTTEKTVCSDVDQSNRAKLTESDLSQTNVLQKSTLQKNQDSKATENEHVSQSFQTTQSSNRYSAKQSTEKEIRESQSQNVTESNKNLQEHFIRSSDQDQQNLHNVSTIRNEQILTSTNKNLQNNQDLINLRRNEDNLIRSDIERQHRNESNEFITNEQYDTTNKNEKIVDTKQKADHIVGRDQDYSRTDGSTVRETSKIIRTSSVQSNTDQKIMNEINKLDTFLSSQNTPVPSEPASPRGVTDGANWTVVSRKDGEFIYQNEKNVKDHSSGSKTEPIQPREKAPEPMQPKEKAPESMQPREKAPESVEPREKTPQSTEPREPMQSREMAPEHSLQPREKMIKHPSSLDLPKEATEGQYVTTYQHSYNRISVDNSPSHEFFVRTLRSSPDRLTPSPTKSSRGSLDRNSPDRRLRATSKGSLDRSSPETSKKRTYSKGSLDRSSPDRRSRTSPGKTSERRGSNESYTIERRKDTTTSHRNDSSIDFKKDSSVERRKDSTLERRKQSRDKTNEINRSKTTERRGSNASYTIESRKDTITKHRNDSSIDFKKDSTRDRRKDTSIEHRRDSNTDRRKDSNTDRRKEGSTDRRKDTSIDRRKDSVEKSNETNKSTLNKDTKTKRKFSSTQQKTANKTRVSTPGVSPSASPTRRGLPKNTTSGSESDLSQATYNKTTSVSSFRENLITTTQEDVVISENTDVNQRKPSGQVKPRDKSPEYSSEGSVSRELKKTSLQPGHDVLPQGSAFKPITQEDSDTLSEDFITNERRTVSDEVRTTDERRENVHKQDVNKTDVDTSDSVIVRTEVVHAPPDVFSQKEPSKSVSSTVRSTVDTTVKKTTVSKTEDGISSKGRSPHSSLERRPKDGPSPGKDSSSTKPTSAPSPQRKPEVTLSRPISQPDTKTPYSSHSPSTSPDRRPKAPQSTPTSVPGQDWGKSSPLSPANSPERRPKDSSHPVKTSRPEQPKFSKSPSVSPQRRPKESSASPERRVTGSSPFSSPDRRRPYENTTSEIKSTRTTSDTNKFITEEKRSRSKESPEKSPTRRSGPYSSPRSEPRDRPERKLPSREKPKDRSHTTPRQTGGRQPSSSPDSRTPSPKRTSSGPLRKPHDTPRTATQISVRRTTEVKETTRTGRRSSIPRAESKLSPRNSKDKIEPKSPATRTPSTATTIRKPTPVPKLNQVTRVISSTVKNTTKSTEKKPLPKSNLQRPTTVHKTPSSSSPTKIPSKSTVPKTPSDRKPRIPDTPTKASSQRTSKIDTVTKTSTRSQPTTPVKSTPKSGKPRKLLEPDVENYHSQDFNRIHTTHHVEQSFLKQERLLDLENENPPEEFYDDYDIETDDTGSPDRRLRPLREQNQVRPSIEETKKLKTTTVKGSQQPGKPSQPIGRVLPKTTKTPVRPEKPSTLRNSTITTKESSVTINKSKQTKKPKVPRNLDSPTSSSSEEEEDDTVDAEEPDERFMKITRAEDNDTTNITTTTASNQDLLSVIVQHPKSSRESSPGYPSVGTHFCTTSEDGESNPRYADFISEPEDVEVTDKTRGPSAPAPIKEDCIDELGSVADRVSVFESTRLSQEPSAPQAEPVQVLKPKSVLKTKTLFENIAKNQTSVQTSKPVDMGYPVPEEKPVQPSNESTDFISQERISYDEIDITERTTAQSSIIKKPVDEPLDQEIPRRPVQRERSPSPEGPKKAAPSETPDMKKPFERKPSGPVVNVSSKKDFFEKKVQDLTTTKTTCKVNDVAPSKLKPSPLFERKTYENDQSDTTDNVNRFDSDVTTSYMKSTVSSSVRAHTPEKLAKDSPRRPEEPFKPTKPSEIARQPSKPEEITRKPSRPEEITRKPSKPDEISRKPSKPEEITRKPSKPEEITRTPSRPEEITRKPSRPEEITRKPSKPEEITRKPSKPEFTNASQPVDINKPFRSETSKTIKTETTEQRIYQRLSPDRATKRPTVHEPATVKPGKPDEITSKQFKAHETTRNVTSQVSHRSSFEQDETVRRASKPDDIRPSAYHSSPIEERRRIFKNDEVTRVSTEEYPRRGSQPEDVGRRPSRPDNVGRRPSQSENLDESCSRQEQRSDVTRTTVRTSETKEDRVGGKFGVTLRKTPSSTKVVVSKPTPQRQISKPGDVVDIESIFDLELLEEMLLKAVGYDERRSIRAQIRVVKKIIEEEKNNSVTNYATSKTRTTTTNFQSSPVVPSVRDIKNQHPSPLRGETQKTPERREPREKSPTKTTSPERRPKATTASSPVKSSSRVTPERSPVRRASPDKRASPERSPTRRASHERTHLTNGYHTTTSSRTSETVSSVRSQAVRRSSNNEVKERTGTDLITSSYGVGPTDEHGKPLFGLRALRRTSTNKTLIDETDTQVEEVEDSSLFGLKAVQQTDTTMPAQANQLRELVERHQQYVRESSSKDLHQPVQKPKAKLRDSFILSQEEDAVSSAVSTSAVHDNAEKGLSLKSIIHKRETGGAVRSTMESSSTVVRSHSAVTSDGKVSLRRDVIHGEVSAKNGETPVGKVTRSTYSYQSPDGKQNSPSIQSSRTTKLIGGQRKSSGPKIEEITDVPSSTTDANRRYSKEYTVVEDEEETTNSSSRQESDRRRSSGYSEERTYTSILKNSTKDNDWTTSSKSDSKTTSSTTTTTTRRSSGPHISEDTDENDEHYIRETKNLKSNIKSSSTDIPDSKTAFLAKQQNFSKSEDKTETQQKKVISRGDSVKALQHKFQQATEAANQPSPRHYPKAGLILRTNSASLHTSDENPPISSSLKQQQQQTNVERSDSRSRLESKETKSREIRTSTPVFSTEVTTQEDSQTVRTMAVSSPVVTSRVTKSVTTVRDQQQQQQPSSFLDNTTKVSGVQDILSRMRNADLVSESGDTCEDAEARSLLNKFLGASVILQGMEQGMRAARSEVGPGGPVSPTSASLVIQAEKQRVKATSVRTQEDDIDDITDEKQLRILLDACSDYENRRRIRARLRLIMAETKGLSEDAEETHERSESSDVSRNDGTVVKTEVRTKTTSSARLTKANSVQSPFAKFRQLERQNSAPSVGRPGPPLFKLTDPKLVTSAATIKERLLSWVQAQTRDYKNVKIENFSTSWSNGLAFCALIHHFCPNAYDYSTLTPEKRQYNFELAFRIAEEEADIFPLLDVEDMVTMRRPDWKCVFTYVQSIYRRFHDSPDAAPVY